MRQMRIAIDVEVIEPGVPVFHVERYGEAGEIFFLRLPDGRWRSLVPLRVFAGHDLPMRWMGDLPPLPMLAATAFPELVA